MDSKMRERIIVMTAAFLFFAAFGAVAFFDSPHGTVGNDFGEGDFTADIEKNQGHVTVPELPDDLLVLGAGQDASLDFSVMNTDEDNDIDTIYITVPGGNIVGGSTEWFIPTLDHEWNLTIPDDDVAKFYAMQDLPGGVWGGSDQYNVAGNIDDALDYSFAEGVSEGITITLDITAPSSAGTKTGSSAINLEISDEQTEPEDGATPQRFSQEPFPYPYLVIDADYEFYMFTFDSENGNLAIDYGNERLFGSSSRASDFQTSQYGFKYTATDGSDVIVLDAPDGDVSVTPVISSDMDAGGSYTLDMVHYKTVSIDPTSLSVVTDQVAYTGDLPATAGEIDPPLDGDGDGLFLDNDDDWDNDGVINSEDTSPFDNTIVNHRPVFDNIAPSATEIPANKELTLTAFATDADEDTLNYAWTVDGATWQDSGSEVIVIDFEPGTYTFHVTISDGSDETAEGQTTVTITEAEEEPAETPVVMIIIIVVVAIVLIGAVLFFVMKGKSEEDEEPMELPPDMGMEPAYEEQPPSGEIYESEAPQAPEQEVYGESPVYEEAPIEEPEPETDESSMDEDSELEEVQDLESMIDEMEKTEEEIGDVCPECGAPLGPTDSECGSCGAQFEIALECPNCGAVVEDNLDKCPSCGVQFQ